ncbi:Ig-like domain-containing protein [Bradyrhizobium macuxiense]|uniref:Ig-like domain-containing protein n=1 Tax=Bradyrhizobium macuxiense TaxID=1755647 RepID=UPI001FD9B86F|nr:Ig-like domain-containing protein [Bradyrhizobium macuxiense]
MQAGGTLTGSAANDSLKALGTGVTLIGGVGDDSYFVYDHNTKVVEQPGQGIDTINYEAVNDKTVDGYSLVNAPNVENLILVGNYASPATGNDLDNIIIGNAGNNIIDGGKGNDVLSGGAGIDTFVIAAGNGNDVITDFKTGTDGDILQLNGTGFHSLSDVTAAMKQVGTDTVLTLSSGETIRMNNTKVGDFTTANVNIVTPPTDMVQTFNDDFNTLSAGQDPHLTWRTSYAWGGPDGYSLSGEQQVYVDPSFSGLPGSLAGLPGSQASAPLGLNPFSIQDGHLVITAQPLPASDAPYVGGHQFSSGMISTQNSFAQTYGYFQMTATLSGTPGAWPAFWMLPTDPHNLATELDVLEAFGTHPDQSHWGFRSSTTYDQGYWANTADLTAGQHTFGVEWTPYTLTYFVDDAEVGQVPTPSDMNTPMYMIANLAMGGDWATNAAPDATASVSIDSITAYQLPEYTLANYTLLTSGAPTKTITGTAGADTLTGTSGNDLIDGAGGADTMSGGAGDDTYIVSDPNAKVVEAAGGGIDTIKSSVTYSLPSYVENLTLTGSAAINATGNWAPNIIIGNDAANVITGWRGNDILTGGGGADTFVFNAGDGSDIITDFTPGSGAGHDVIQLNGYAFTSFSDIQAAMTQVGNDVYLALTSQDTLVLRNTTISSFTTDDFQLPDSLPVGGPIGASFINGSAASHTIYGTSANDKITAFNYDDTMIGWSGDDTYVVNNPNQKIIENPGGGIDTVEASTSYTLPDNVENLTMMMGGFTGTGNQLANRIVGSSGDDVLNGGGGNDWISGGAGNDTFVYTPGSGNVTIADFHPLTTTSAEHDQLSLKGYDPSAYLTNVGDVWTVHYARGTDTLQLVGVNQLTASDVTFVTDWNTPMTMAGLAAPTASFSDDSGVTASNLTATNHLTLTGSAQAGVTVEVFDQAALIGTAVADATGAWSFATATLADGSHLFTAEAADAIGNLSAASAALNVTVDTQPPLAPNLISAGLASGSIIASGSAEGGSTVNLYDGTVLLGTTVAASDDSWSINADALAAGLHKLSAIATDEVGNQSPSSNVLAEVIGTTIEATGTTSFTQVGDDYYMSVADAGVQLKYAGAPVTAGQFGTWSPVAAEATSSGYDVAWQDSISGQYAVWSTDSNGNFASKIINSASGTDASLKSVETAFHQDLNGDGVINTPSTVVDATGKMVLNLADMSQPVTIETGATLELTGAVSGAVTFNATAGTLVLDHASQFSGNLINLSGNGTPSTSNQIDLKDIAFTSATSASYSGDTSGGVLTVFDAQNHTANLSLSGDYTNSTFKLSNDGSGGTLVIDPPKDGSDFGSVSTPQPTPAPQAATAARTAGDNFVFDRAGSSAGAADFTFEPVNNPAMPQLDRLHVSPAPDHVELPHVVASVDARLAEFHNFMLHQ